jgi:multicomponent Na+:H+ antiporter subunit D
MLRAGARVFLGWGAGEDELLSKEPPEGAPPKDMSVSLMTAVTGTMVVLGLVASVVPGFVQRTEAAAERFVDHAGYVARVLHGTAPPIPSRPPVEVMSATAASLEYGVGALVVAFAVAAIGLWHQRLPDSLRAGAARLLGAPVAVVRAGHSGIVGDYLLWLAAGTALVGGVWAFTLT